MNECVNHIVIKYNSLCEKGQKIKDARHLAGLSQAELERRIHNRDYQCGAQVIARVENGQASLEFVQKHEKVIWTELTKELLRKQKAINDILDRIKNGGM